MTNSRSEYIRNYDRYLSDMLRDETAYRYIKQVYDYLELMKPGTILNLQADPTRLPWMLVACGAFLTASDHWIDYELNDDYTKVRRKFVPPNFRAAIRPLHIEET